MNSGLSLARSKFAESRWATDLSADMPPPHPSELNQVPSVKSSLRKLASLAITRVLTAFCIGVGATLAWQSYGDAGREMIARSSPKLAWLAPQAAQTTSAASAGASPDLNQLKAMSRDLAAVRQSVDKLAAEITKLQATKQGTPDRTSAPPPAAVGAPGRKPVPPAAQTPQAR
jgi:hypothetical protein